MSQEAENNDWSSLRGLLLEEWPALADSDIDALCDDDPALIKVIAETAGCTTVRARRDLAELRQLSTEEGKASGASQLEVRLTSELSRLEQRLQPFLDEGKEKATATINSLQAEGAALVDGVEEKIDEVQQKVKAELDRHLETTLPEAEAKLKQNIWTSLAIAFGLGMIIGLLGGPRGR